MYIISNITLINTYFEGKLYELDITSSYMSDDIT
jgi:hypothetical protein